MDIDPNLEQNHETMPEPEPVRSRWTPKPEQILILESIFNSGMVNPPKEETVRIRKLLEKFGTVGDANVFYWFQNRRSRSRRRQRQMQAGLGLANTQSSRGSSSSAANFQFSTATGTTSGDSSTSTLYGCNSNSYCSSPYYSNSSSNSNSGSYMNNYNYNYNYSAYSGCYSGGPIASSSSSPAGFVGDQPTSAAAAAAGEDLFAISRQMGFSQSNESHYGSVSASPSASPSAANCNSSQWQQYQSSGAGTISVFINGVAMEVPNARGGNGINLRTAFGQDVVLVSSSGDVLPVDEYGFLMQALQMGESYFAVPRST